MGAAEQITFLEELADEVEPVIYYDPDGERHRVVVTQLTQMAPYKHEDRFEPVVQLVMIDAWAGVEVQQAETAKARTVTSASLYDHEPALWGEALWGWAEWG